ncbi:cation-translocating P-type ATPase [Streptomyces sp. J2-1]|uniref:cation-translocating P-type ATPase n=1 Tax=Streptomyces corallincola TaxID=2851888 RepID=UPI001C393161|nr:cation-translocating P-type ATPase [Streptomyces corallincola]MBV2355824.1 cation-translocating P-type ATPase [Streptomyces corallincola]
MSVLTVPGVAGRFWPVVPRLLADAGPAAVGLAAGALAGSARAGARGVESAGRVARVAGNAVPGGRAGGVRHLVLRPAGPEAVGPEAAARGTAGLARRVAAALAEHPDVLAAYWDEGLARLVVRMAEAAAEGGVLERVGVLADRHGLVLADGAPEEELPHPADPSAVRLAAAAVAADAVGVGVALTAHRLRLPASPRVVTALVTFLRENPRVRAALRRRLGGPGRELALTCVNAAAHGAGQSPAALLLDGSLQVCRLVEAVAGAAAFEAVHDELCVPERTSVGVDGTPRPPLRATPAEEYAAHAATGSVLGAVAALLVKHDVGEAAEAVLAGSPKAARYGPAAFHSVLAGALARVGVLVRDPERLRQLELARTLVLHPSAVRGADGAADAWTEPVLEAARRARLRIVLVDDPVLEDFAGLADQVVDAGLPLDEVVREAREGGGAVVAVARMGAGDAPEVLAGLRGSDLAVALTDRGGAAVWSVDVLARHGLADVWRLLVAVPAARGVGRRAQVLARSGAALSGLLVAVGESPRGRRRRRLLVPGLRHAPVDVAAAAALVSGVRAAVGVAVARAPRPRARVHWHALGAEEARERVVREPDPEAGFGARVSAGARVVVGHPVLGPVRWSVRLGQAVRGELDDPLTPVLAVGSAASALLGSAVDALLVVGALDLNALVGGVQRLRAERAVSGLLAEQKRKARVAPPPEEAPAGGTRTVEAGRLRPGDVIELAGDDVVPADGRLLWEEGLEVDESALTGESLPVRKRTDAAPHAAVADRHCMVFEGTTVVAGRARALVVDTGERTEAARAVHLAARTPAAGGVQARLQEITARALPWTLAGGAGVTALSLLRGTPVREAVSGGVAVAVAAVPEGLPLVATVAQLAAARRLGRRGVLVRTPRTLEALGRMDTVCFDKTGTLTENRLRLVRVCDAGGTVYAVDDPGAAGTVRSAARACPRGNGDVRRPVHATDEAVLDAAGEDSGWTQLEGLPFEAGRGYAAAVGRTGDGVRLLVVKGAPETVLPACPELAGHAAGAAHELAGDGLRVLAVAERVLDGSEDAAAVLAGPLGGLGCTGLLALSDVPRATSEALVNGLYRAGVRPVMLTGDHPRTARAIARDLGWPVDPVVVTGEELTAADRSSRARMLREAGVVARVAPEQKLQVVEALRDAGRVVGMVGDGANDAAAIRAADIGVGINARGSAAARNAADIVLTDDDLTVLVDAVGEGRALWHSVADAIAILIGGNAGEVGFGLLGTLLSGRAPLSTRQMLLVNLFTDLFPAMAVAVTPSTDDGTGGTRGTDGTGGTEGTDGTADRGDDTGGGPASGAVAAAMRTLPDGPEDAAGGVLGEPLMRQIRHRALTTCLGACTAWLFGRFTPGTVRRSSTMALCAVVGTQLAQTLLDRRDSPLVRFTSLGSAAALVVLVQFPGVSRLVGCTPLGPVAWAGVAAGITVALAGQRALPRLEALVRGLAGSTAAA